MIKIVTPAPLVATSQMVFRDQQALPRHMRAVVLQCCQHESYGMRSADQLVAAFGFWPIGPGVVEMWVVVGPETVRHLVAFIRFARLAIVRLRQDNGVRIIVHIRVGHEPGKRLATMAGLSHAETIGPFERWETNDETH